MAIQDILVHIDNSKMCDARLQAAVTLAQQHNAHITGLYLMPQVLVPTYAEVHVPADILQTQTNQLKANAARAEQQFKTATSGCMAQWLAVQGDVVTELMRQALYTDLIVVGQPQDSSIFSAYADIPDQVVMGAVRPVLAIPYIGAKSTIGQRIMVAWNASREAARAVADALPLLEQAEQVDVVAVNPPSSSGDIPCADVCHYLARHGVKTEASQTVAKDIDIGDVLLSRAADQGTDLLVIGAYGHTRFRETILGGVTKQLLEHMTIPVLLSH